VDGVNELPSDRGRAQAIKFRELYQKTCPMIFTTRELSAGGDLGIAKRLEMQPLTEPQMQQFVMAYLPTQGERLLRQLSGRLREFGQTPLLLWMLCSLFQQSEQIPPNLGMVFRAFTVGYGDRIKQDVTLSKDSRVWWGRLLQYLAFKMTCGESLTELQVAISRREVEQFLVEFLRGKVEFADDLAVRWLEDLLKHHLIQISNDRIEFRHQLIQEYYAAEWLRELLPSLSNARLQQVYLNYLKWTEPLALMLELVESEEQAVRVVKLALEVDLRLGARLAGAVKYEFQEKTVGLLLREIEERKIPQLYAIELLGETNSDYAIESLMQALEDNDSFVHINAAKTLGKVGGDRVAKSLIHALKDKEPVVRVNAVNTLGKIGFESVRAVESLIHALKDKEPVVRVNAADALGKIGIGSVKATESLIQTLEDNDYTVRWNVAKTLGKIGGDKSVEPLINFLQDKHSVVRWNVAEALGKIGSDKAIEPLILALNENRDPIVRGYIVEALGGIGSDRAIEPLIIVLKDQYPYVRWRVVEALGKIGSDKAIEPLILALKDEDEDYRVRRNAAEALGKIGSDKAVESLILTLIKDPENSVRKNGAEALGKIGSNKAIEPLIHALKDKSPIVRGTAAKALGMIDDDKALDVLIRSLKNEDYWIRSNTAVTLGKFGMGRKTNMLTFILLEVLEDHDSSLCRDAIAILGKIGGWCVIKGLIPLLQDHDFFVRQSAAKALSEITSPKLIYYLYNLIPTTYGFNEISFVISNIQARCKYYNYDIAQTPLQEENNNDKVLSNPQGSIIHMTEIKNDFSGANFGGANIANLGGTVNEQKIVQKTEVPKQNLAEATKEVQELLTQLAKTNPSEATIAHTIQQEIKRNSTLKARLVNALKTGGIEALKAIFNNPFVSIPVETVKGFLEAEE
jgi:HEAT repeat protein